MSGAALTLNQIDAQMSRGYSIQPAPAIRSGGVATAAPQTYFGTYQAQATRIVEGQVSAGTQGALAAPATKKSSNAAAWAIGGGLLGALAALVKLMLDWSAFSGPGFWTAMGTVGLWALIGVAAGYLLGKMLD